MEHTRGLETSPPAGDNLEVEGPRSAGRGAPEAVRIRVATDADLVWCRELAREESVAASLSTDAADGVADALVAGELWIAQTPDGERVGAVRLRTLNRRSGIAAVETLMVHPDARGRGWGVAIVRALTRDAFARGLHRLEAEVYAFNEPALRTFDAAGFRREGVRRRAYDRHGAWQDGVRFGLLADD
jgi:ribosomal protein S18 acetylase RimI-like enzyme